MCSPKAGRHTGLPLPNYFSFIVVDDSRCRPECKSMKSLLQQQLNKRELYIIPVQVTKLVKITRNENQKKSGGDSIDLCYYKQGNR